MRNRDLLKGVFKVVGDMLLCQIDSFKLLHSSESLDEQDGHRGEHVHDEPIAPALATEGLQAMLSSPFPSLRLARIWYQIDDNLLSLIELAYQ